LRDIALGQKSPGFKEMHAVEFPSLNFSQNLACQKIDAAEDFAVVHGPPGTGKTTTLIAAIRQAVEKGRNILVSAPSNAAVDLLVAQLAVSPIRTLRIVHPARADENIRNQTPDAKIAKHDD